MSSAMKQSAGCQSIATVSRACILHKAGEGTPDRHKDRDPVGARDSTAVHELLSRLTHVY